MQHYIRLLTQRELADDTMSLWFETVVKFAPSGIVIVDDSMGDADEDLEVSVDDDADFGDPNFPYIYEAELTRHLQKTEAEFIVSAWEVRFKHDFEIEISNIYDAEADMQHPLDIEIDEEIHGQIEETAAKFNHNRRVEKLVLEGWRYGLHHNTSDKTSPGIRDWDSLDESYRKRSKLDKREALDFYAKYKSLFQ